MLLELPAEGLVMRVVPQWTRQDKRNAILAMMQDLNCPGHHQYHRRGLGARR